MKTYLYILTLGLGCILFLNSCVKAETICNHANGGRCTGSANCSACSNCSGCKYCNSGGSCGVCGGGYSGSRKKSENTYYSSASSSKKPSGFKIPKLKPVYKASQSRNSSYVTKINDPNFDYSEIYLKATFPIVNVRKGAGENFEIIESIRKGDWVIYVESEGDWTKVKVKKSGNIGFIYYKNLK